MLLLRTHYGKENYMFTRPTLPRNKDPNLAHLEKLSRAADSIAVADVLDKQIRNGGRFKVFLGLLQLL